MELWVRPSTALDWEWTIEPILNTIISSSHLLFQLDPIPPPSAVTISRALDRSFRFSSDVSVSIQTVWSWFQHLGNASSTLLEYCSCIGINYLISECLLICPVGSFFSSVNQIPSSTDLIALITKSRYVQWLYSSSMTNICSLKWFLCFESLHHYLLKI
jgi:hypothetical protein